jgi:hypothetical protein
MKKIIGLVSTFAMLFVILAPVSAATDTNTDKFSSPAAHDSFERTANLDVHPNVDELVNSLFSSENNTIAYTSRSTGCSTGCSMGCSTGCSTGCSVGCR